MKPLHDYIIIQPETVKKTSFEVEQEDPSLLVGTIIAMAQPWHQLEKQNVEHYTGKKVLYRKYGFDEYDGKLIGKMEHIVAILD